MIARSAAEDIPRISLMILAIGLLIASSFWIMLPFSAALVWATMIVIATWPILLWIQARLGGRRSLAVVAMLVALLGFLVAPIVLGVSTIIENADRVAELARSLAKGGLPPLPDWVERIPLAGPAMAGAWRDLAGHADALAPQLTPYLAGATRWLLSKVGSLGTFIIQFILTIIIAGVLYASGETAARGVRRFLRRLGGERGENAGILAARAARAVAIGVVVTAVAQTAIAGAGLALAGTPGAGMLTAVVFVLCIAQLGPLLVVGPATIWLYASGSPGRATVMLIFALAALLLDNFLRPLLIKRGADLPLLLILSGVIGGLIGFGIIGLFVGPVVLAVTWTLLGSWIADLDNVAAQQSGKPR